MKYASRIQQKKFSWGGIAFATPFPAHGSISVVGSIRGGTRFVGSFELAHIHADMLLEGTSSHTKKELQLMLDDMGASLTFYATDERLCFSGRVLRKHAPAFLSLVSEILREPIFPETELSIYKQRGEAALSLEAQDTNRQANIALSRLLFEKEHPNFAESTPEAQTALRTVSSESLRALHASMIGRSSLILSVAGDLPADKVFALCEKHFSLLPDHTVTLPRFRKARMHAGERKVVQIPEKVSIDYVAGITTSITNDHSDFPALLLGLQVLGSPSGFSGRLMKTVREEEGLTYGVYAYMNGCTNALDGYICVWGTFAQQLFLQGRAAIRREVARITQGGVTEEEIEMHREMYYLRSRVRLSTSGAYARAAHDTAAQGKPLSYLDEFPARIRATGAKEVNRALKKYLKVSELSEAAAGPLDKDAL